MKILKGIFFPLWLLVITTYAYSAQMGSYIASISDSPKIFKETHVISHYHQQRVASACPHHRNCCGLGNMFDSCNPLVYSSCVEYHRICRCEPAFGWMNKGYCCPRSVCREVPVARDLYWY